MKKLIITLGLGALLMGTSALALPISPPPDDGKVQLGAFFTNIEDDIPMCSVIVKVPGYEYPLYLVSDDVTIVKNKNMIKSICRFHGLEFDEVEQPIKAKGFECKFFSSAYDTEYHPILQSSEEIKATDSKFVLTPSGEARMECSFKANKVELD